MRLPILLALAALAACADAPAPGAPPSEPADASPATDPSAPTDTTSAPAGGPRSIYTDLDLDACETLKTYEDGGVDLRCPGYDGIPLYVSDGDARMDIDAGVPNEVFTSQSAFNLLGDRVEWRIVDDVPVAIIVRYRMDVGDSHTPPLTDELAVITIGREGAPGCLIDWVPAGARPSPNEAARALADREAAGFVCPPAG